MILNEKMSVFKIFSAVSKNPSDIIQDKCRSKKKNSNTLFAKSDEKSKVRHQPDYRMDFKEHAIRYGMDLQSKRNQDMKERDAIEKKMAKQSVPKGALKSRKPNKNQKKNTLGMGNFFKKHSQ